MQTAGAATIALKINSKLSEFGQHRQNSEGFVAAPNYLDGTSSDRPNNLKAARRGGSVSDSTKYRNFWDGIKLHMGVNQHSSSRQQQQHHYSHYLTQWRANADKTHEAPAAELLDSLGPRKLLWDLFIVALVIYSVMLIPFQIGFDWHPTLGVRVLDYIIDALFFVDILATFNTTYKDAVTEEVVYSRRKIAAHYLSFWFWIDLCSTIPFDDIVQAALNSEYQLSATRSVRILRMIKFFRLYKLNNFDAVIEERLKISPAKAQLVWLVLQIYFIAHIFACFWHFLSLNEYVKPAAPQNWVTVNGFSSADKNTRYVAALYYVIVTMLTVGYGDISPTNSHEMAFSIVLMLTGGVIFGALIGKVTGILERQNPQNRAYKENMDELRAFLDDYALPEATKVKVKKAYAYYLQRKSSFGENGIFSELPSSILYSLVFHVYEKDIKKVTLFHTYDCSFVVPLVINSRPFFALRGEVIFHHGDVCEDVMFLTAGVVSIAQVNEWDICLSESKRKSSQSPHHESYLEGEFTPGGDVLIGFCTDGGYFGDLEYYKKTISLAQYTAVNNCHMLAVSDMVLNQVIAENFKEGKRFQLELRRRHDAFLQVRRSPLYGAARKRLHRSAGIRFQESYDDTDELYGLPGAVSETPFRTCATECSSGNNNAPSATSSTAAAVTDSGTCRATHPHLSRRRIVPKKPFNSLKLRNCHRIVWMNGAMRAPSSAMHYMRLAVTGSSTSDSRNRTNSSTNNGGSEINVMDKDGDQGSQSYRVISSDRDGTPLLLDVLSEELHRDWLVHPNEPIKIYWDCFIALFIICTLLVTPIDIAFSNVYSAMTTAIVDDCISVLFILDMMISFRTGFEASQDDAVVVVPRKIYWHYFTSWFVLDFASSLPLAELLRVYGQGNSEVRALKLLKALRLFRLVKLVRLMRKNIFDQTAENLTGMSLAAIGIVKLLIEVFFVAHWVACLWWGLAAINAEESSVEPWFNQFIVNDNDGSILRNANLATKYLVTLYFTFTTMTTVGYGDISATNTVERILNMVLILVAATVFGYIIAHVSQAVGTFNLTSEREVSRLSDIKEFLKEKDCPPVLETQVIGHFKHLFSITSAFDVDKILSRLPHTIRAEILLYHHEKKLKMIPIFRHMRNHSLVLYIFRLLIPSFHEPDQILIHQGREATEIQFLTSGTAVVVRQTIIRAEHPVTSGQLAQQSSHNSKLNKGSNMRSRRKLRPNLSQLEHERQHLLKNSSTIVELTDYHRIKKGFNESSASFKDIVTLDRQLRCHSSKDAYDFSRMSSFPMSIPSTGTLELQTSPPSNSGKLTGIALSSASRSRKHQLVQRGGSTARFTQSNSRKVFPAAAMGNQAPQHGCTDVDDTDMNSPATLRKQHKSHSRGASIKSAVPSFLSSPDSVRRMESGMVTPFGRDNSVSSAHPNNNSFVKDSPYFGVREIDEEEDDDDNEDDDDVADDLSASSDTEKAIERLFTLEQDDNSNMAYDGDDQSHRARAVRRNSTLSNFGISMNDFAAQGMKLLRYASRDNYEVSEQQKSLSASRDSFQRASAGGMISHEQRAAIDLLASSSNSSKVFEHEKQHDDSKVDYFVENEKITAQQNSSRLHAAMIREEGGSVEPAVTNLQLNKNQQSASAAKSQNSSKFFDTVEDYTIADLDGFSSMTVEDMHRVGVKIIGELHPGEFYGHVSLMNNSTHSATVIAKQPCTVYALSRIELHRLLKTEPAVAIPLQEALGAAVKIQNEIIGKRNMRENRAQFLRGLRREHQLMRQRREIIGSTPVSAFDPSGEKAAADGWGVMVQRVVMDMLPFKSTYLTALNAQANDRMENQLYYDVFDEFKDQGQTPTVKFGDESRQIRVPTLVDRLFDHNAGFYDSDVEDEHWDVDRSSITGNIKQLLTPFSNNALSPYSGGGGAESSGRSGRNRKSRFDFLSNKSSSKADGIIRRIARFGGSEQKDTQTHASQDLFPLRRHRSTSDLHRAGTSAVEGATFCSGCTQKNGLKKRSQSFPSYRYDEWRSEIMMQGIV